MKVIYTEKATFKGDRAGQALPISQAVEHALDGRDNGADEVQALFATTNNLRKAVAILTAVIAEHGLMQPDELQEIVGYEYEVRNA